MNKGIRSHKVKQWPSKQPSEEQTAYEKEKILLGAGSKSREGEKSRHEENREEEKR
jgi:hypothetical protein